MAVRGAPIVIAGAGIAGLSAACRLQREPDAPFVIFEKDGCVGGCSRTLQHGAFRFDLGGHRFYTRKLHVQRLVEELLGDDLVRVDRLSRILFRGRLVNYPLRPFNTLKALGPLSALRATLDYGLTKLRPSGNDGAVEETFEQWALKRFGQYLYRVYFKVYTEKTWGVPCSRLSADFAEQRIKGLSFREAVRDALFKKGSDESLVRRFIYPRRGFGQVPDAMARAVAEPNRILTQHAIVEVEHDGGRVVAVTARRPDGAAVRQPCRALLSSLSIDELARSLRPAPPAEVLDAAGKLPFRSLVVLVLFLDVKQVSPDHWIYVPSPDVGFCRIHEPKNWSPEMSPPGKTSLVLEYFCQQGDEIWNRGRERLAAEAAAELERIGLIRQEWVRDSALVRLPKAYPVYELGYRAHLDVINRYLGRFDNLFSLGRNATFVYTSSDHYMDMGLKAAENLLGHGHDLTEIGREPGYAES